MNALMLDGIVKTELDMTLACTVRMCMGRFAHAWPAEKPLCTSLVVW